MMVSSSPRDGPGNGKAYPVPAATAATVATVSRNAAQTYRQYQHSVQFTMTRKIFDKGPDVVRFYRSVARSTVVSFFIGTIYR